MRPDRVVVSAPLLDQDLSFPQGVEQLAVKELIPEPGITDDEVDDYLRVEGGEREDSLAGFQKQREDLHAEWVEKKGPSFRARM